MFHFHASGVEEDCSFGCVPPDSSKAYNAFVLSVNEEAIIS
jgi:hypothetical protein